MCPFVTIEHRENPDMSVPGDRCYYYYKEMVDTWKKEPRWTTADRIYTKLLDIRNNQRARLPDQAAFELAWQVFFIKYVMPYEDEKEKLNGSI